MTDRRGVLGRARASLIALGIVLIPIAAPAQTTTARLSGTIKDPMGASVPVADVSATNVETARMWTASTDDTGTYNLPALPPGTYRVTAERTGFKVFATEVRLEVNQVARIDVVLEVGPLTQRLDVKVASTLLHTDSTELGLVIRADDTARLPSNGRNFLSLLLIAPGAIATNLPTFVTGARTTSGGRPYFNGNRKEANNLQLDGVDNNQTTDNLVAYQPSPDAIEEIKITTNNPPAEIGNFQGASINTILKSGTNHLHGSVFEFLRNDVLNATNWFRNQQPIDPLNPRRKTPLRHNVFGATLGGPLLANHVFFFGDYQGTRRRTGYSTTLLSFVPSAMRNGDFSALLQGGTPQQLYDPATTRPDPANPGQFVRDPFPNNQIPIGRFDPVATSLFASPFYEVPALPGVSNNVFNRTKETLENNQFDVKIDAKIGPRDDFSARYAHGRQATANTNSQAILMATGTRSPFRALAVHWIREVTRNIANETRLGFNRIVLNLSSGDDIAGIGSLGEDIGIRGSNRRGPGLPGISFGGAAAGIGNPRVVQDFTANTFQYQDNLLWHRGAHAVKMGVLALQYQQDVYFSGNNGQLGLIEFTGQYTRDLNDPRSIGSPIADFALGYPTRLARGDFAETWQHRSTLWAGFLQDDWRASNDITVNIGLRYEYRTPFVETHDRQVNFDLKTGQPRFPGVDGNSRGLYEGYKRDWQPRLGVAWTPDRWRERLVLRGGYTISSFLEGTGTNLRLTLNPPFFNEFETTYDNPAVLGSRVSEGFDSLREKDPLTGTILRAWDPQHRPARSQQWNVTLDLQLAQQVAWSVAYVGQFATGLVVPVNFDQRTSANGPRPFDAVYPQIGGVILTTPNANQRYDALQVLAQRRFRDGWSLIASYTLSRALSHGRGFFSDGGQAAEPSAFWPNPRDRDADWGPVPFDARRNATVAGVLELPWGRGRRWLCTAPPGVEALVGGWSVAGIWKAHSGFPVTILAPDQSQTGARSGRPDQVAAGRDPHQIGREHLWFDTSVFMLPVGGTFGNAEVGSVRGPGLNVIDFSASKRVAMANGAALELEIDAFNLLNTPVFNAPDRSLTSATFGHVVSSQLEREIQISLRVSF
jgi:carboxypeptidase family protein